MPSPVQALVLAPTPQASTYRIWPERDGWSPARSTPSPIVLDSASCPPVPVRDEHVVALPQGEGMVFGLCAPWSQTQPLNSPGPHLASVARMASPSLAAS